MNWDAVGALSELIGAVAVIITLIYLAVQVKQATIASRFAATATVHNNFNHTSSVFSTGDNDTMVSHRAMKSLDGLTEQQIFRFGAQLYAIYCHFDMVYHLHLKGSVDEDEFIRALLLLRWFHQTSGVQTWWHANTYDEREIRTADLFTLEFKELVTDFEKTGRLPLPPGYQEIN